MRVNCTRTEYIGLLGARWQTEEIPHVDRVRLESMPIGLMYIEGPKDDRGDPPALPPGPGDLPGP